jgi:HD-GYP domain-containing protein (c-di-GMP phosphodiesterase class II)
MKNKSNILALKRSNSNPTVVSSVEQLTKTVEDLKHQQISMVEMVVRSILQALDCKDHYTFGHSMRVTYFSLVIGKEMNLTEAELKSLEYSALFHDIGKIGIPDAVLNKPSRLTDEEFEIMKSHPEKSATILSGFSLFEEAAKNARLHHERFDGRGYPEGLKGEAIPLYARIILIADTFDAMTSTRPYRKGLPYAVAYEELMRFSGTQFDPMLVQAFIRGMRKEENKGEPTFYIPTLKSYFEKDAA